jgi:hypothetical protein
MQPHGGQRGTYTQPSASLAPQAPQFWTHQNHRTGATDHYALSRLSIVGWLFQFVESDVNYRSDKELFRESFSSLPTSSFDLNVPSFPEEESVSVTCRVPHHRASSRCESMCPLLASSHRRDGRNASRHSSQRNVATSSPAASPRSPQPEFNILACSARTQSPRALDIDIDPA